MKGLKTMVLDQATVVAAVQKYLNEDIKSGVELAAVVPYDSAYPNTQSIIPKEFQILFAPPIEAPPEQ